MNIPLNTRLETERGYLQCLSVDDADFAWSASQTSGFTDGMSWEPPEKKEEIIERTKEAIERFKEGNDFGFTMYLNETHQPVGRISIRTTNTEDVWNTGYWVHPDYQGQGFATEMLSAIVRFGFETVQADRITSEHAVWNEASGKVLKKVGFSFLEHLECGFMKHGKAVPEDRYQIRREEWQASSQSS